MAVIHFLGKVYHHDSTSFGKTPEHKVTSERRVSKE